MKEPAILPQPVADSRRARWVVPVAMVLISGHWAGAAAQEPKRMPNVDEQKLLEQPHTIPELLATKRLSIEQVPNPHWRRDACGACHRGTPSKDNLELVDKDINKLCNTCHSAVSEHDYIHPVGMVPTERMIKRMRPKFRAAIERGGGKVTCIACHDVPAQCLAERQRERALNPLFFWNAPYRARSGLCYHCHDPSFYDRLNAHDQVTDGGQVVEDSCLICHADTAQLKTATGLEQLAFNVDKDLSRMCTVCHPWIPHPAGVSFTGPEPPDHLVAPSPSVAKYMQRVENKSDVKLPLDPTTGQIFCGTCHDPHEQGVLPAADRPYVDAPHQLRAKDICILCHDM